MKDNETKAITVLKGGGIVIFPTDTAYGIGCRIDDTSAIDRLYKLRNRPLTQATPVLVSSLEQALQYYDSPSDTVFQLAKAHWPGALTIVAPCRVDKVYILVRGGKTTIGLRMPNDDSLLRIIQAVGVPILGPSANFHDKPTPFTFESLDPDLVAKVDFVLPGLPGSGEVSTVVDASVTPYRIIREGAIAL